MAPLLASCCRSTVIGIVLGLFAGIVASLLVNFLLDMHGDLWKAERKQALSNIADGVLLNVPDSSTTSKRIAEELEYNKSLKVALWYFKHLPPGDLFSRQSWPDNPQESLHKNGKHILDYRDMVPTSNSDEKNDFNVFLKTWRRGEKLPGHAAGMLVNATDSDDSLQSRGKHPSGYPALPRRISQLNIPETAHTAVNTFLQLLLGCKSCSCSSIHECTEACPRLLNQCGHSVELIQGQIKSSTAPAVVSVSILRSPAHRVVSSYFTARRYMHPTRGCCGLPRSSIHRVKSDNLTLLEFAKLPGIANVMTRMLAGRPSTEASVTVDTAMYQLAVRNLKKLTFFGIAECLPESLYLLRDVLATGGVLLLSGSRKLIRQQVAIAVRKAGRATTFYDDSAVPAHVIRQLEEVNTYDMQLYRVAVSHFQKQLRVGSSTCRVPLATA